MEQPLGPRDRDFVCNSFYRSYTVTSRSWASAEALPCLHCGSKETTPIIEVRVGDKRIREYSLPVEPLILKASS